MMGDAPAVLVVEDDLNIRELYEFALGNRGYTVVGAPTAEIALECVEERAWGLVVCDRGLPGMNGVDLVRRLRALPGTAVTPIVMISAWAQEEYRRDALDAGADRFLGKPFQLGELYALVDQMTAQVA